MPANTSNSQQEANFLDDDDAGNNEEANDPIIPGSHEQDTGVHHNSPPDCQNQVILNTIPKEKELKMKNNLTPQTKTHWYSHLTNLKKSPSSLSLTPLQMTQPLLWANQLQLPSSLIKYKSQLKR